MRCLNRFTSPAGRDRHGHPARWNSCLFVLASNLQKAMLTGWVPECQATMVLHRLMKSNGK
jgi:hypothetical protein